MVDNPEIGQRYFTCQAPGEGIESELVSPWSGVLFAVNNPGGVALQLHDDNGVKTYVTPFGLFTTELQAAFAYWRYCVRRFERAADAVKQAGQIIVKCTETEELSEPAES